MHDVSLPLDATMFYLDANPLIRWAECQAGIARDEAAALEPRLEALLSDETLTVALSEITIVEVFDVLCRHVRNSSYSSCDDIWFNRCWLRLLEHIESERLKVRPTLLQLTAAALELVERATKEHRRNLRAWDAAHLQQAAEWANETGRPVAIVTHDSDFSLFLEIFPEYARAIRLYDLQV
jgi:predicted nucleic acid-binding protein